jgi:hypothetical protein
LTVIGDSLPHTGAKERNDAGSRVGTLLSILEGMTLMISPASHARQIVADILWTYGEDRLATRAEQLTDQEIERLQDIADDYSMRSATSSGAGMLIARAIALAAVEVMEAPRPLARTRRRSLGESPYKIR